MINSQRDVLCNRLALHYAFLCSQHADNLVTFGQHSTLLAMLHDYLPFVVLVVHIVTVALFG